MCPTYRKIGDITNTRNCIKKWFLYFVILKHEDKLAVFVFLIVYFLCPCPVKFQHLSVCSFCQGKWVVVGYQRENQTIEVSAKSSEMLKHIVYQQEVAGYFK